MFLLPYPTFRRESPQIILELVGHQQGEKPIIPQPGETQATNLSLQNGLRDCSRLNSGPRDRHGEVPARLCCAPPAVLGRAVPGCSRTTAAFVFHQGEGKGVIALISITLILQQFQRQGRVLSLMVGREGAGRSRCAAGEAWDGLPSLPVGHPGWHASLGQPLGPSHHSASDKRWVRSRASSIPVAALGASAAPQGLTGGTPPAATTHPPSAPGESMEQREVEERASRPCHAPRCAQPALRRPAPCLGRL